MESLLEHLHSMPTSPPPPAPTRILTDPIFSSPPTSPTSGAPPPLSHPPNKNISFSPHVLVIPPGAPPMARRASFTRDLHLSSRTLSVPLGWTRRPSVANLNDEAFIPSRAPRWELRVPVFRRPGQGPPPRCAADVELRSCLRRGSGESAIAESSDDEEGEDCARGRASSTNLRRASSLPPRRPTPLHSPPPVLSSLAAPPPQLTSPTLQAASILALRPCCPQCFATAAAGLTRDPPWTRGARLKHRRDMEEAGRMGFADRGFLEGVEEEQDWAERGSLRGVGGKKTAVVRVDEVDSLPPRPRVASEEVQSEHEPVFQEEEEDEEEDELSPSPSPSPASSELTTPLTPCTTATLSGAPSPAPCEAWLTSRPPPNGAVFRPPCPRTGSAVLLALPPSRSRTPTPTPTSIPSPRDEKPPEPEPEPLVGLGFTPGPRAPAPSAAPPRRSSLPARSRSVSHPIPPTASEREREREQERRPPPKLGKRASWVEKLTQVPHLHLRATLGTGTP